MGSLEVPHGSSQSTAPEKMCPTLTRDQIHQEFLNACYALADHVNTGARLHDQLNDFLVDLFIDGRLTEFLPEEDSIKIQTLLLDLENHMSTLDSVLARTEAARPSRQRCDSANPHEAPHE